MIFQIEHGEGLTMPGSVQDEGEKEQSLAAGGERLRADADYAQRLGRRPVRLAPGAGGGMNTLPILSLRNRCARGVRFAKRGMERAKSAGDGGESDVHGRRACRPRENSHRRTLRAACTSRCRADRITRRVSGRPPEVPLPNHIEFAWRRNRSWLTS